MTQMTLNPVVGGLDDYLTKAISMKASSIPGAIDLSFGLPAFGPPETAHIALGDIAQVNAATLDGLKRYESPRGMISLRREIADWYNRRYQLSIDPESEILVTHGGVEAITLSILTLTEQGAAIGLFSPAYMLYERTVSVLGRKSFLQPRPFGGHEYKQALDEDAGPGLGAIIMNSPENPSGYIASEEDLDALAAYAKKQNSWIIHDEVYDTMTWERPHIPCLSHKGLRERSVLINSCSKKFGMPGLRIGWMIAPKTVIDAAARVHDYMYLGVNIQSEHIAQQVLSDPGIDAWLSVRRDELFRRAEIAVECLNTDAGFIWPRLPQGAMFLFPNVRNLADRLGLSHTAPAGLTVAEYLLDKHEVAVTPGSVYGANCNDHVRIVMSGQEDTFRSGLARLAGAHRGGVR